MSLISTIGRREISRAGPLVLFAALASLFSTGCAANRENKSTSAASTPVRESGIPPRDNHVIPPAQMRVYGKPTRAADADSIQAVMLRFGAAWARGDAEAVALAYAVDAEWTNAFGRVKSDRSALESFLRTELFVDSAIAGTPGRPVQNRPISFRFLNESTAIIHMYTELEGQLSAKGHDMGYRRTHHTYVLGRLDEGWRIVHHMIMDQRDPVD